MQGDVIEARADGRPSKRKSCSEAYKRRVVALTLEPGASVARIAQRHGVNANLLFTWRRQLQQTAAAVAGATLLPVTVDGVDRSRWAEPRMALRATAG